MMRRHIDLPIGGIVTGLLAVWLVALAAFLLADRGPAYWLAWVNLAAGIVGHVTVGVTLVGFGKILAYEDMIETERHMLSLIESIEQPSEEIEGG